MYCPCYLEKSVEFRVYTLIGEAYVHGKMDGQAAEDKDLIQNLTQWFDIE